MGCVGQFPDYYPVPTYDKEFIENYYNRQLKTHSNVSAAKDNVKKVDAYLYNIKGI